MQFQVQGSAKTPYIVTVYGSGADMDIRCNCPAGARGGLFCKHVAALLTGDVTNVVKGADQVALLADRAQGSPLIDRALMHNQPAPLPPVASIDDIETMFRAAIEAAGYGVMRHAEKDPLPSEGLTLHAFFKNGRMKKGSLHELWYEPETADLVAQRDGSLAYENRRPKKRRWLVRGKNIRGRSFSSPAKALEAWFGDAGLEALLR